MIEKKRILSKDKVPRPPFDFENYKIWRSQSHQKFVVEVGCGAGFHPIQWAKENPHHQILAIERTTEKFEKFEQRVKNHPQLKNIFPAHNDASTLLPHIIEGQEIDEVFILYPNPYPKSRQKNQRFAFHPLTGFLAEHLKKSGSITFATNIESYALELKKHLGGYNLRLKSEYIIPSDNRPRSHFEKKYLLRGEVCFNLIFGI